MLIEISSATSLDREFILEANKAILVASGLTHSSLEKNIDDDLLSNRNIGNCLIIKFENKRVGMCVYSDVYWADNGKGIYLSQIYIEPEHRGKGIVKQILQYIMEHNDCNFITCLVGPENECMKKVMDGIGAEAEALIPYILERNNMNI